MPVLPKNTFMPLIEPVPPTLGRQIQAAFRMFRLAPGVMVVVPLLTALAVAPPLVLAVTTLLRRLEQAAHYNLNIAAWVRNWLLDYSVVLALALGVSVVVTTALQGAVTHATGRACLGYSTKTKEGMTLGFRRWFALFAQGLIAAAPGFAAYCLMLYGFWQFLFWQIDRDYVVDLAAPSFMPFVIGLLALFPGLAWSASLSMAPSAIVLEGRGLFAGIARSLRLTRGSFGRILGRWLAISLLAAMASASASNAVTVAPMVSLLIGIPLAGIVATWEDAAFTLFYIDRRIAEGDFAAHITDSVLITPDDPLTAQTQHPAKAAGP